jgi:RNA recognition motif-containing protein
MSTRVFVGNLSFKTRAEALQEHFSAAGTVEKTNIITRGPRSLGYGFVDFKTAADAENAIKLFDQKQIDDRVINVELARPQPEKRAPESARPRSRPRPRRRTGEGGRPRTSSDTASTAPGPAPVRRYRRRVTNNADAADGSAPAQPQAAGEDAEVQRPRSLSGRGRRRGRGRGYRGRFQRRTSGGGEAINTAGSDSQGSAGSPQVVRKRRVREPRPPRPSQPKIPSETTLFVANLPFSVDDAELAELFSGLNVTKTHVVTKRNHKSKGFGFVEFANQGDQLAALKAKDGQVFKERLLTVKVALVPVASEGDTAEGENAPAAEGAAATKEETATPAETKEDKGADSSA